MTGGVRSTVGDLPAVGRTPDGWVAVQLRDEQGRVLARRFLRERALGGAVAAAVLNGAVLADAIALLGAGLPAGLDGFPQVRAHPAGGRVVTYERTFTGVTAALSHVVLYAGGAAVAECGFVALPPAGRGCSVRVRWQHIHH